MGIHIRREDMSMRNLLLVLVTMSIFLSGCAMGNRFDPLSPRNKNARDISGKLDEMKTNQDGIMLDLMKQHQESNLKAGRDAENQQGVVNLSGDGAIIALIVMTVVIMGGVICIVYYRTQAKIHEKAADILAHEVAVYDDANLDKQIYAAAMNSPAEKHVCHIMLREQQRTGKTRA